VQTLGELFNVLVRKAKRRPARTGAAVLSWRDAYPVAETSATVTVDATDLASDHGLTIWDSVVLAAAAEAGCRLLLSEDLQEGFTWRGVTVTNPFAPALHPLLAARVFRQDRSDRGGPIAQNAEFWGRRSGSMSEMAFIHSCGLLQAPALGSTTLGSDSSDDAAQLGEA
jgi:PIN domain